MLDSQTQELSYVEPATVRLLPNTEVLLQVFHYAIGISGCDFQNTGPLVLSRVCRRWRDIIFDDSYCWRHIRIVLDRVTTDTLPLFEKWASHIKSHFVGVCLWFHPGVTDTNPPLTIVSRLFSVLSPKFSGCVSVDFMGINSVYISEFLHHCGMLPHCQYLCIDFQSMVLRTSLDVPIMEDSLQGHDMTVDSSASAAYIAGHDFDVNTAHNLLRRVPGLRSLRVEFRGNRLHYDPSCDHTTGPIQLPDLWDMDARDAREDNQRYDHGIFWQALVVPSLRSLAISAPDSSFVKDMLMRSRSEERLHILYIDNCEDGDSMHGTSELFKRTTHLTALNLQPDGIMDEPGEAEQVLAEAFVAASGLKHLLEASLTGILFDFDVDEFLKHAGDVVDHPRPRAQGRRVAKTKHPVWQIVPTSRYGTEFALTRSRG